MYFPNDMNFQYFFFSTYPGYFLQVLPIALLAGAIDWLVKEKNNNECSLRHKITSALFTCYITGLISLVLLLPVIGDVWYRLLYHMDSGVHYNWFCADFNFVPDFWRHLNGESVGNMLLFLPFGILFPLCHQTDLKKTVLAGVLYSLGIEILQPVFGRAFDVNDIILNTLGTAVTVTMFYGVGRLIIHKDVKS